MPVLLLTDGFVFLLLGLLLAYGLYAARHEHLRAPWRRVVESRVGLISLLVLGAYGTIGLLDTIHFHPRLKPRISCWAAAAVAAAPAGLDSPEGQAPARFSASPPPSGTDSGLAAGEWDSARDRAAPSAGAGSVVPEQTQNGCNKGNREIPSAGSAGPAYGPEVLSLLDLWLTTLRQGQEKTYSAPFATHLSAMESLRLPDGSSRRDYPRLVHGGVHLAEPARERGGDLVLTGLKGLAKGLLVWGAMVILLTGYLATRQGRGLGAIGRDLAAGRTSIPWRAGLLALGLILVLGAVTAELAVKYHVLGTDKVGEDVLYQALKSVRTGLVIGTLTTLVMLPAALLLGIMAGYFRGLADDVIQYLYTTLNSIPGVLLIAAAVLMLQVHLANHEADYTSLAQRADLRLLFLCLILGVTSWTGLCRLLRGEALKLGEADYVQAAQALGVGHLSILGRHILPNVMHLVIITLALDFSGLVLAEAVLSYINIGVDPTMNSWGNMINGARLELAREPVVWWSLASAFAFMFVLVLSANLLADVVRDAFDPRLSGLTRT